MFDPGDAEITPAPLPIDLVWIDYEALAAAPFYEAAALLTELGRDGVEVGVVSSKLGRMAMREALFELGLLEMLDYVWHKDALKEADSTELRRLAAPTTLAIREVRLVRYEAVRRLLRRRTRKAAVWELRAPLDSFLDSPDILGDS